jgi:hypothetical protein
MNRIIKTWKIVAVATILLSVPVISGCGGKSGQIEATGKFEATEIIVSAEATGKIMEISVKEGMNLTAGDMVGYIDTLQLYLQKERLLAGSDAVRARRADVGKQIAVLEQQISNLNVELERAKRLVASNAGNTKTVDDIESQINTLNRQIEAQRSVLERGNLSADKESHGIELQVAQTEDMIRKSRIVSPITGTILAKYAEPGEFTAIGRPLFKIADLENMILRAYFTYDQMSGLKLGDEVQVSTSTGKSEGAVYKGVISWISEEAEFTPKTIQTKDERTNLVYAVKISVKNDGYLKIGMYGDVMGE